MFRLNLKLLGLQKNFKTFEHIVFNLKPLLKFKAYKIVLSKFYSFVYIYL